MHIDGRKRNTCHISRFLPLADDGHLQLFLPLADDGHLQLFLPLADDGHLQLFLPLSDDGHLQLFCRLCRIPGSTKLSYPLVQVFQAPPPTQATSRHIIQEVIDTYKSGPAIREIY